MLNPDIISGKWKEVKGVIRSQWGKLTDDDLERAKGDLTAITGLIQEKYGKAKEEVSKKLDSLLERFEDEDFDDDDDIEDIEDRKFNA